MWFVSVFASHLRSLQLRTLKLAWVRKGSERLRAERRRLFGFECVFDLWFFFGKGGVIGVSHGRAGSAGKSGN